MKQSTWAWASLANVLLALQCAHADRVDTYLEGQMQQHRIPGLTLKIIRDGKTIKTAAYGLANLELNVPAKPETVLTPMCAATSMAR